MVKNASSRTVLIVPADPIVPVGLAVPVVSLVVLVVPVVSFRSGF